MTSAAIESSRTSEPQDLRDAGETALRRFSGKELLSSLQGLCRRTRAIDAAVVFHLAEMERRGLHVDAGFSSLFQYCTERLGLSRSVAGRRLQVARCLRRFPSVRAALENGILSVAAVGHLARVAQPETVQELVERVAGKTEAETEQIATGYGGKAVVRESAGAA